MNHPGRSLYLAFALLLMPIYLTWAASISNSITCKSPRFYPPRTDQDPLLRFKRADLETGEPFVVRSIYFVPSDRSERLEFPARMDSIIKEVQAFYADQMEGSGNGRKTFVFETDAAGQAIVHRVRGQFPDSHYLGNRTFAHVEAEVGDQFSLRDNIYLIAVDVSDGKIDEVAGIGQARGPNGGVAMVPASDLGFHFRVVTHELGHAFGLSHDFNDDAYIMSYGTEEPAFLSAGSVEYLAVNRFFNPGRIFRSDEKPAIRTVSSLEYPSRASSIRLLFELTDDVGLHQALLLETRDPPIREVVEAYTSLNGLASTTIEFSYSELSEADAHRLAIKVIDVDGNTILQYFSIYASDRVGQTWQVAQSNGEVFTSISVAVAHALPRDKIEITDSAIYDETIWIDRVDQISLGSSPGVNPTIGEILIHGAKGLLLEGLSIVSVSIHDGAEVTLRNNTIAGNDRDGLYVEGSTAEIAQNIIERNGRHGIVAQAGSHLTLRSNAVTGNQSWGIIAQAGSDLSLTDNIVTGNHDGLYIEASTAEITQNIIEESGRLGMYLKDANIRAEKNTFRNNSEEGIIAESGSDLTLVDNTVTGNHTWGIIVQAGSDLTLTDNIVTGNHDGLYIEESSAEMTQNSIEENGRLGMYLSGANIRAEKNTICNNSNEGILAQSGSDLTLTGNTITDNGDGITISKSQGVISDNTISDNRDTGMAVLSSSPKITNNTISGNDVGIHAGSAANPVIHENNIQGNTSYGIYNGDTSVVINGENNWWGHESGPWDNSNDTNIGGLYNPEGQGDKISDAVDYEPWKNTPARTISEVKEEEDRTLPRAFLLAQNYPNPFNLETIIPYHLPEASHVKLIIWNALGHPVSILVNTQQDAGRYSVRWDGRNGSGQAVPSGVYLLQLQTDKGWKQTRKMIVLR